MKAGDLVFWKRNHQYMQCILIGKKECIEAGFAWVQWQALLKNGDVIWALESSLEVA